MPPDLRYTCSQLHSFVSFLERNAGLFEDAIDTVDAYSVLLQDHNDLEKKSSLQKKCTRKLQKIDIVKNKKVITQLRLVSSQIFL